MGDVGEVVGVGVSVVGCGGGVGVSLMMLEMMLGESSKNS